MTPTDVVYMQRALSLAARGKGRVSPNPLVGCVIVKNGKVIAEGHHEVFGGPHAEINALQKAGARARGATMYVTLEPCSHWGKTGPCAPRVIEAGLRRVHVAMADPFPAVSGRGLKALRRAGIKVSVGLEESAARHLNRAFLTNVLRKRPHVVYKAAMSLDGKTAAASGDSRWISGEASRSLVHRLRAESDAIAVGATTAIKDNPFLTSHGKGRDPLRVVIDRRLRVPASSRVYDDSGAGAVVVTSRLAPKARRAALERRGVRVLAVAERGGQIDLKAALKELIALRVGRLMLEGGGETAWSFLQNDLIDEALFFVAPVLLGGRASPTPLGGEGVGRVAKGRRLQILSTARVEDDLLVHALVRRTGDR